MWRFWRLGDSPNDLPLLEAADLAVVVPGVEGPHPSAAARFKQRSLSVGGRSPRRWLG